MLVKSTIVNRSRVADSFLPSIIGAGSVSTIHPVQPKVIFPVDDISTWVNYAGSVVSADTINCRCSTKTPAQSVKVTSSGTGPYMIIENDFAGTVDVNNCLWGIRFYIHEGTGDAAPSHITAIRLKMYDTNGDSEDFYLDNGDAVGFAQFAGQWVERTTSKAWKVSGSNLNFDDIAKIRLSATLDSAVAGVAVTFDKLWFFPKLSTGLYCPTFDDGRDEHYEAALYLSSKGISGTFAIISGRIGDGGFLTLAQLKEMQEMGHLLVNHGWASLSYYSGGSQQYTNKQIADDITKGQEWLINNGLGRGARIWVQPGGDSNWRNNCETDFLGKYYDMVRITNRIQPTTHWNTRIINTSAINSATAATTMCDRAVDTGALAVICFHQTDGGSVTWDQFKAHIDHVAGKRDSGDIKCITLADLYHFQPD